MWKRQGRGYGSNRPQCQLCGKFGHLVHCCFQRLNVHFQGVTAQSYHEISTKLSPVQWNEEEDVSYSGPSTLSNINHNSHPKLVASPMLSPMYNPPMYNPYISSTTLPYPVISYIPPILIMPPVPTLPAVVPITPATEVSP